MPALRTDDAFLERARRLAPELLDLQVDFDALVARVLRAGPYRTLIRPRGGRKRRLPYSRGATSNRQAEEE